MPGVASASFLLFPSRAFENYIATAMPLDRPGSLGPAANADILAFILKANAFPAGTKELSADNAALKAIRFDAVRPAAKSRRGNNPR